ncbi:MAG: hypothetical protein GC180_00210 [Bacteroidetes bacterium]|nr:hypothetical protein [Bacteroidota bacterium]
MKIRTILLILFFAAGFETYSFSPGNHYNLNITPKKVTDNGQGFQFDKENLTYGGYLGLNFGTLTYVNISPLIGYWLTDQLLVGTGLSYIYYRQNYSMGGGSHQIYQTNLYGGRILSEFQFLPSVFAHGEIEYLNFNHYDFLSGDYNRIWFSTPMLGLGYSQPMGNKGSYRIMALFAFKSENSNSPYYQSPLVYRIGFLF